MQLLKIDFQNFDLLTLKTSVDVISRDVCNTYVDFFNLQMVLIIQFLTEHLSVSEKWQEMKNSRIVQESD